MRDRAVDRDVADIVGPADAQLGSSHLTQFGVADPQRPRCRAAAEANRAAGGPRLTEGDDPRARVGRGSDDQAVAADRVVPGGDDARFDVRRVGGDRQRAQWSHAADRAAEAARMLSCSLEGRK